MPEISRPPLSSIHVIDLNFLGLPSAIAAYLIPHREGAILVESGPGSTISALESGLKAHGYRVSDVSDVFLTHIHLDHAGAAGWLARQGARVHVHPVGAPHLLNPEKLLASAARLYGDSMEQLWGEFLPVPEERLSVLQDNQVVEVFGLRLRALDTPGHASHHYAYISEDVCFSGDIGGIRIANQRHLRPPMVPPEFNLEQWRASLNRLHKESFTRIAPTHFGLYSDPDWHLAALEKALDQVEAWMLVVLPSDPPLEAVDDAFQNWIVGCAQSDGVPPDIQNIYEAAIPSWMSAQGIYRYWHKYRKA